MAQQNLEHTIGWVAGVCLRKIAVGMEWRVTNVSHSHYSQRVSATDNVPRGVIEQIPSHATLHAVHHGHVLGLFGRRRPLEIVAVVVVAQNRAYAFGGIKS